MTTAASAGWGRSRSSPGAKSRRRRMAAAPTRPVTWVLAPFSAATAVRDPLVLTGKPWKKPAAMFAAPTPIISRSPSTSAPARAANADAVEIVSVKDTNAIPSAPTTSSHRSLERNGGNRERRNALRHRPDHRHAAVLRGRTGSRPRSRAPRQRGRPERGGARAGSPGSGPGSPRRPRGPPPPWLRRQGLARTRPPRRSGSSASTEKPKSLGSWPTTMVSARPFMYPICVGLDRSSATNPSLKTPASTVIAPTINASNEA